MSVPKKFKNNIEVYSKKELLPRRQEMLDEITKSDTYLPDTILHDDLDRGMLDYVQKHFRVVSGEKEIPVIPRILTIQRWGELTNTWEFTDDEQNIQLPFISIVRKPDAQPGTNPSVQRTIPDRHRFHYATVKTWNGGQVGANVYKIPQPIAVDISYDVTIVCTKFRDLNKFNKIIMERFCSRQDYTIIKGHYVPIIFERTEDNTPMDLTDGRRFYIQTYQFTLLGFLIDGEEFEVKPAINRVLLLTEFITTSDFKKTTIDKTVCINFATFTADGMQTQFSVGETIGVLFYVTVNGLKQEIGIDFYHVAGTSKITFATAPVAGSVIVIAYYKGRHSFITDNNGRPIQLAEENFIYDGSTLTFTLDHLIDCVVTLDINGLIEDEGVGFNISGAYTVTLVSAPVIGSRIGISYLY
jgi:hypothetical protein